METNNRVHNSSCKAILLHCKFRLYTIFFTNTELLHTLGATNPVPGTCTCSGFAHSYGNIKVHFLFTFLVRWWIFIPSLASLVFQQCPTRPKTTREVTAFSTPLVRRLILLKQGHCPPIHHKWIHEKLRFYQTEEDVVLHERLPKTFYKVLLCIH